MPALLINMFLKVWNINILKFDKILFFLIQMLYFTAPFKIIWQKFLPPGNYAPHTAENATGHS